jgi:hypothetical protein
MTKRLIKDSDIAETLSMSRSWVRGQRYLRRHSLPHILSIDPIMIGSNPRYRVEEFERVITELCPDLPVRKTGGNNG